MFDWRRTFDFVLPTKIIFGPGTVGQAAGELAALGGKRPVVVTDKGVATAGITGRILAALSDIKMEYTVYDGVEPNPKDVNVEACAAAARGFGADSMIAVGGGSAIDCAKSVGVLLAHGADRIKPFEGKTAATKRQPPFVAVPTTAGTGSEITFSSVITDTENSYKMTVKSPFTAANVAVCDPELTLSKPAPLTAATGVDALTHAIEGFTVNCGEPLADAAALYAIELIWEYLPQAVRDGRDLSARSGMLMGSVLAGIAFSHADVGSVHCIAESLGGVYDLPHGVCNAIFLPYVMEYNMDYCTKRYARAARAMGLEFGNDAEGAALAVAAVKRLVRELGLPAFSSLPVDAGRFGELAAMSARNISTASNPRPMAEADYMKVLKNAWGDQP